MSDCKGDGKCNKDDVAQKNGDDMKLNSLGFRILIGSAVGLAVGFLSPRLALAARPVGDVFLRMLKMLMVPLVFFCITAGVCKMGDVRQLRTVGVRFVLYIVLTSGVCALVGVAAGLLTGIGSGTREFIDESATVAKASFSFVDNAVEWFPENVVGAMENANMVQIIVFSLFLGVALLSLGEKVRRLAALIDDCGETMLKITDFVMSFAPIGIGSLMATMVITIGGDTAKEVISFVVVDNLCCFVILLVLYPALIALCARLNAFRFFHRIMEPVLVALTTTSSAATLPVSIRVAREKLGIPENVYGFTLPLGNTCGMNGFAAYIGLMSIFAYRLYGHPVTVGAVFEFVFLGIVLSIGAAGVKGSGIIMSTVLLETMGLPLGIVPIIAAIWPTVDPAHTVVNNVSDLVGTTLVAGSIRGIDETKWKGNRKK